MPDTQLGTCLARFTLRLHPLPEDSGMSFIEQRGTPRKNLVPVELLSSMVAEDDHFQIFRNYEKLKKNK